MGTLYFVRRGMLRQALVGVRLFLRIMELNGVEQKFSTKDENLGMRRNMEHEKRNIGCLDVYVWWTVVSPNHEAELTITALSGRV